MLAAAGLLFLKVETGAAIAGGAAMAAVVATLWCRAQSAFERVREAEALVERSKPDEGAIFESKLIEAIGEVVYRYDVAKDQIQYIGDTERLCGRTRAEMGTTVADWIEMIHPEDRPRVIARFEEAQADRRNLNVDYRIRSGRGETYRWILDRGALTFDENGEMIAIDGVCADIENRKRSEERFRLIFDDSREPHFLVDSGGIVECNAAAVRMLGVGGREELIGGDFRRFWPETQPDGRATAAIAEQVAREARSGRTSRVNLTKVDSRGKRFVVEVSTSSLKLDNHADTMLVVWRDLREVEAARNKLSTSENRYQHLVETLHQIVYQADIEGNWTYLNPAWERVTGFSVDETLGEHYSHFIASEDLPKLKEIRSRELSGENAFTKFDVRLRSRNGRYRTVEGWCRPLIDEVGDIVGTTGILTDETERLQVQRDLETAKEAAEAANRAKGEFLAVMSHEIRTPLNGVLGFADLLRQTPLSKTQDEYLRTIRGCGDSLLTLIDDILDFSRLESGHMELEQRPVQLRESVEGVLDVHSHRANDKGIEIVGSFAADLPMEIRGDVTRLRQVLSNLVGNAVKFTDEGHVLLRGWVAAREGDKVELAFRVEDTGPGIPPDKVGKLFHPFVQADASMSRRYGGTGLGLAICRRLVEAMGGSIAVGERAGRGTAIEFSIVVEESEAAVPEPKWAGRRVLVIDHNEIARNTLVGVLSRAEIVAVGCPTTRSALSWLAGSAGIDLILLSSTADEVAGGSGMVAIAERAAELDIPVLVVLPLNGRGSEVPVDLPGERGRIAKPVHLAALWRSLERIFSDAVTPAEPGATSADVGPEIVVGGSLSVLLVEDNLVNTKLMLRMLSLLGPEADHAADGEACLRRCEDRTYDLILMDVQLPGMDGIETTERLRARGYTGEIVALTAHAMPEDRERCLSAGMNDYLTKPVQMERLRETLAGVERPG